MKALNDMPGIEAMQRCPVSGVADIVGQSVRAGAGTDAALRVSFELTWTKFVAINAPMRLRGECADIETPRSPGPPVAVANVAARAPA